MSDSLLKKIDILHETLNTLPSLLPLDPPESTFFFGLDDEDIDDGGEWMALNRNLEFCFQRHLHPHEDFLTFKYRSSNFEDLIFILKEAVRQSDDNYRKLIDDRWIERILNAAIAAGATLTSTSSHAHHAHNELWESDDELISSDINIDADYDIGLLDADLVLGEHIQCTHGSSQDGFTSDAVPHTSYGRKIDDHDSKSTNLYQSKLVFPKISKKAAEELAKKQSQYARERRRAAVRREASVKAVKAARKKELGRLRAKKFRDGRREAKKRASDILEPFVLEPDGTHSTKNLPATSHEASKGWKSKRNGKKGGKVPGDYKGTNWFHPFLWALISSYAIRYEYSSTLTSKALARDHPALFNHFYKGTMQRWLKPNTTFGIRGWNSVTLGNVERERSAIGERRAGVLSQHPAIIEIAKTALTGLRANGVPLSISLTRSILLAIIQENNPELLGGKFKCSEWFVCKFLANVMGYTPRRGTRAAAHIPANADEVCERAFFRLVNVIKEFEIPPSLVINMDQTGVLYIPGYKSSYEKKGSNQVNIVGKDEKRGFTLCVSSTPDGQLLPFQLVFQGKTVRSSPDGKTLEMKRALSLGIRFMVAASEKNPTSHYSTLKTMKEYMNDIFRPHYLDFLLKNPRLPRNQKAILYLDAYPVHTGQEFLAFLRKEYPYVLPIFVPANCTGVFQPADVGLQKVIKHAIKQHFLEELVKLQRQQLADGIPLESVKFATSVGVLRNATVPAIMEVFDYMKTDKGHKMIKMAWRKCAVKDYNLSEDKLLDPVIRLNKLTAYLKKDDTLSHEIAERKNKLIIVPADAAEERQDENYDEPNEDDSSIPLSSIIEKTFKIRIPARCSKFCSHSNDVKESESGKTLIPSAEEEDVWAFDDLGMHWGGDNLPVMD